MIPLFFFFFFFNDTATTEIYTLSLHDALPICLPRLLERRARHFGRGERDEGREPGVPAVRVAVQVRPRRHLCARRAAVGPRLRARHAHSVAGRQVRVRGRRGPSRRGGLPPPRGG